MVSSAGRIEISRIPKRRIRELRDPSLLSGCVWLLSRSDLVEASDGSNIMLCSVQPDTVSWAKEVATLTQVRLESLLLGIGSMNTNEALRVREVIV